MQNQERLDIRQMEVTDILTEELKTTNDEKTTIVGKKYAAKRVIGVRTYSGATYSCNFMYGNIFEGAMHLWGGKHADGTKRTAGG